MHPNYDAIRSHLDAPPRVVIPPAALTDLLNPPLKAATDTSHPPRDAASAARLLGRLPLIQRVVGWMTAIEMTIPAWVQWVNETGGGNPRLLDPDDLHLPLAGRETIVQWMDGQGLNTHHYEDKVAVFSDSHQHIGPISLESVEAITIAISEIYWELEDTDPSPPHENHAILSYCCLAIYGYGYDREESAQFFADWWRLLRRRLAFCDALHAQLER